MVDGGGVGLLPALCLRRMAWVLFTLLTESGLSPSSAAKAAHSDRSHQRLCISPSAHETRAQNHSQKYKVFFGSDEAAFSCSD